MRIRDLREKARDDLRGNMMKVVIPTFAMLLISYLLSRIPTFISDGGTQSIVSFVVSIISALIVIPLSYALIIRTIKVARKEELSSFVNDAFDEGIRNGFSCAWGIFKKIWYWVLIMVVGYVLIIVGSAMVISSNFVSPSTVQVVNSTIPIGLGIGVMIAGFAIVIFAAIKLTIAQYKYFLVQYLKHDYPEKTTKELLEKSKEMMEGNKAKAVVIPLTFIGWALLAIICMVVVVFVFGFGYGVMNYSTLVNGTTPETPIWLSMLISVICYFVFSFITAYLQMTYTEFYLERNPLEIYNEDYVKPETNAKKYISIIGGTLAVSIICYLLLIRIVMELYLGTFLTERYL